MKDLPSENPNQIKRTLVKSNNKYVVVSTIQRDLEIKMLDSTLSKMGSLLGEERGSQLGDPGDYESMVFRCDENGVVQDWSELKFCRYGTQKAAESGHDDLVKEYSN